MSVDICVDMCIDFCVARCRSSHVRGRVYNLRIMSVDVVIAMCMDVDMDFISIFF